MREIDQRWQGLKYQPDARDGRIKNCREQEFTQFQHEVNRDVVRRIDEEMKGFLAGGDKLQILNSLHVLDLHESGKIDAHIDSEKFTGPALASLSLIAGGTLKFREYQRRACPIHCCSRNRFVVDIELAPGTLYIMSGMMRYEYTHELVNVTGRRLSILRKLDPAVQEARVPQGVSTVRSLDSCMYSS